MNSNANDNLYIVNDVPFQPELPKLLQRLHVKAGSPYQADVERVLAEAQAIARPKALYKVALIESKGEDEVVIDSVTFTSRVLRVNLENAHRVFAYVATCGTELDAWVHAMDDILFQYWGDAIKEIALDAATQALHKEIADCYEPGKTAIMSPGSLTDWPLSQQRPLFAILGNVQGLIGVELSDSFLMTPNNSVSCVRFPTADNFASCQLCPRDDCPGRRAPYDKTLYERKYRDQDVRK